MTESKPDLVDPNRDRNVKWIKRLNEMVGQIATNYYSHEYVADELTEIANEIRDWNK